MRKFCWAFYCCYSRYVFPKSSLHVSQQPSLTIIPGLQFLYKNKKQDQLPGNESSMVTTDDEESSNEQCVFPERYLTEHEKKLNFNFTKKAIVQLIEDEINNNKDYTEFYNKNNMILYMNKKGSIFNSTFPCIKMIYKMKKNEFNPGTSIKILDFFMNDIEARKKWDGSLKNFKKIEGNKRVYILHSVSHKPSFFISEREVVDKRFDFYANDAYYDFSSSVNDSFVKGEKDVVRTYDYFSGYKMYEDKEYFMFYSITQIDFKMNVPQAMYNATMPMKLLDWYQKLKTEINKNQKVIQNSEIVEDVDDENTIININQYPNKDEVDGKYKH